MKQSSERRLVLLVEGDHVIDTAAESEALAAGLPSTEGMFFIPALTVWARRNGIQTPGD